MSTNRQVGIATLIWAASNLLSRIIGLVREAVIGRTLGGGADADVFWTSFVMPDFLNYLLAGGALSIVFIPIFAQYLQNENEEAGWQSFSMIFNALALMLLVVVPLLWIATPLIVPSLGPGFDPQQLEQLTKLTRIILPAQIFHLLGGMASAALMAKDQHKIPAITGLVYTSCIILGGLIAQNAEGFAYGVLAGSLLGPFLLPMIACHKMGMKWSLGVQFTHQDVRTYFWRSLPIMLGFSIIVFDDFMLKRLGSLQETGSVATLQYAKTLMKVPIGIFGLAFGVAVYPKLSAFVAEGNLKDAHLLLMENIKRVLFLALGAQVTMSCVGADLATVIYGGRLMEGQATDIGMCLVLMCIGLWGWAIQTIMARGFYARGNTWLPTILGSIVTVLAYPVYVLLEQKYGIYGLAGASAVAISVYVIVLEHFLAKSFDGNSGGLWLFLAKMMLAVLVALMVGYPLMTYLPIDMPLLRIPIISAIVGMVYVLMTMSLKIPEIQAVQKDLSGKILRRLHR